MSRRRIYPPETLAAKPTGQVVFDTNDWTSGGGLRQTPEPGRWMVDSRKQVYFEDQLTSTPWLIGLYVAVLALFGVFRFVLLADPFPLCAFALCFALPLLAIVTIHAVASKLGMVACAHHIAEDVRDPDVCPVVLTILQNGLVTGEDAGVAWFDGPSLFFNGDCCSFAVGRRDVLPEAPWKTASRTGQLFDLESLVFLRTDGKELAVRLSPAFSTDEIGEYPERARLFMSHKKQFKAGPGGPERSTYPPLEVSPMLKSDPLPFRHQHLLQTMAFIYFAILAMVVGAPAWAGLILSAACALCVPLLRPRRNPKVVAV